MLPLAMGVGRFAMQALPYLTAAGAALPSLREGKPLEAAVQGGLGFLTGGAVKGGLGQLTQAAAGRAGQAASGLQTAVGQVGGLGAQKAAAPFLTAKNLRMAAQAGIPLAGIAAVPAIASSVSGGASAAQQAAQPLAGQAAQTALGYGMYRPTEVDYGAGLPSYYPSIVGQYGGISPVGSPTDILGPLGIGRSLETQRQAKAGAEAMRLLGTEQMRFTEAAKRKDFERQAAMKGIAQNIMTQAAMLQGAQQAAINMGQTGMEGVSRGLTQLYQYQ